MCTFSKPTIMAGKKHVVVNRLCHSSGTPSTQIYVNHFRGRLWFYTLVGPSCKTLLQETLTLLIILVSCNALDEGEFKSQQPYCSKFISSASNSVTTVPRLTPELNLDLERWLHPDLRRTWIRLKLVLVTSAFRVTCQTSRTA